MLWRRFKEKKPIEPEIHREFLGIFLIGMILKKKKKIKKKNNNMFYGILP